MNLIDKTKAIQGFIGAKQDGIYGNDTATLLLKKLGLYSMVERPAVDVSGLVKGTGKNIKRIFIHCSATREGQDIDAATIKRWHLAQGWKDIGYHYVIRLDGTVEIGRPENVVGSHVAGFNTGSIGICYVGGLDSQGKSKDTRTPAQKAAMESLVKQLTKVYTGADVLGHRDASPDKNGDGKITPNEWLKDCPCFDVREWWKAVRQ